MNNFNDTLFAGDVLSRSKKNQKTGPPTSLRTAYTTHVGDVCGVSVVLKSYTVMWICCPFPASISQGQSAPPHPFSCKCITSVVNPLSRAGDLSYGYLALLKLKVWLPQFGTRWQWHASVVYISEEAAAREK